MKVIHLSHSVTSRKLWNLNVNNTIRVQNKVSVKLPDPIHFLTTGGGFKEYNFDFDEDLFDDLCRFNLTGKVSYNTLRTAAIGYSMRRQVHGSKIVKANQIEYDQIDIHVILALVTMSTYVHDLMTNPMLASVSAVDFTLMGAKTFLLQALSKQLIAYLSTWLSEKYSVTAQQLGVFLQAGNVHPLINDVETNPLWLNLLKRRRHLTLKPLRLYSAQ